MGKQFLKKINHLTEYFELNDLLRDSTQHEVPHATGRKFNSGGTLN